MVALGIVELRREISGLDLLLPLPLVKLLSRLFWLVLALVGSLLKVELRLDMTGLVLLLLLLVKTGLVELRLDKIGLVLELFVAVAVL